MESNTELLLTTEAELLAIQLAAQDYSVMAEHAIVRLAHTIREAWRLNRRITCTYCGHTEERQTEDAKVWMSQIHTHIQACPQHPINRVAEIVTPLVEALKFVKDWFVKLEDQCAEDDPLREMRRSYHAPIHARIDEALAIPPVDEVKAVSL